MTDPVMLLSQIHGEGRVTFRALRAAGFNTIEGVAHASLHVLSDRAHLSMQTARRLKSGAEEMLGRGIATAASPAEPGNGSRGRLTRGAGRNGRGQRTGEPEPGARESILSAGVTLEEAGLLGQGAETAGSMMAAGRPEPPEARGPEAPSPMPHPAGIAAAAEMAASLIRPGAEPRPEAPGRPSPAPAPAPHAPRRPPTYWSFG